MVTRFFGRTGLLQPPHVSKVPLCDLGIMSIECDDVSGCTVTPRSILDAEGKSGKSFLEFLMLSSQLRAANDRVEELEDSTDSEVEWEVTELQQRCHALERRCAHAQAAASSWLVRLSAPSWQDAI
eukprot:s1825_g21.t2